MKDMVLHYDDYEYDSVVLEDLDKLIFPRTHKQISKSREICWKKEHTSVTGKVCREAA